MYLVNEFNTSKKLYLKGNELEKFRKRKNPRPYKNNIRLIHGLLRSKSVSNSNLGETKNILVNRDLNGSLNIWHKARCIIENKKIPKYLQRISRASSALLLK